MSEYIMNKETGKIELHFDKSDYMSLPDDMKKEIKSNFLFSKNASAWVSRAKFPNTYRAELVAKKLGLKDGGKIGETLSFAEQMERKAERAEARAERYDYKSDRAYSNGKSLQKPIDDMHGDIAFFTQPNINTSSGRAFTNRRNSMFAAWERGFDEFKKSEYYAERADAARRTAESTKPTNKGFIDRRIKDAEKTIRAQRKNIKSYEETLEKIKSGNKITRYNGELLTVEEVEEWIEDAEEILENAISKSIYYHECMEELGGVQFSKENIKPGYIVKLNDGWRSECMVCSTGKVNFTYQTKNNNGKFGGFVLKAAYAEIDKIVSTDIPEQEKEKINHPFKAGDKYTVKVWNGNGYDDKEYTITKITDSGRVTLKTENERAISRKPYRTSYRGSDLVWAIQITDSFYGTVYKKEV